MAQLQLLDEAEAPRTIDVPKPKGVKPMAKSLKELIAAQAALAEEIRIAKLNATKEVFHQIDKLLQDHDMTPADLLSHYKSEPKVKGARKAAEAKYRDPATGATWSGRGKPPKFISASGKDKSEFLIK